MQELRSFLFMDMEVSDEVIRNMFDLAQDESLDFIISVHEFRNMVDRLFNTPMLSL